MGTLRTSEPWLIQEQDLALNEAQQTDVSSAESSLCFFCVDTSIDVSSTILTNTRLTLLLIHKT